MEIRKVEAYRHPRYPDKEAALQDPALLLTLPERWRANTTVCAALVSVSTMLLAACNADPAASVRPGAPAAPPAHSAPVATPSPSTLKPSPRASTPAPATGAYRQVPLFEHGAGYGAYGCVSVSPPVFLTEQEARDVISEAAKREGIDLSAGNASLEGIELPDPILTPVEKGESPFNGRNKGALALDGADEAKKIAYEFISSDDLAAWSTTGPGGIFEAYPFMDTARALSDSLGQADTGLTVGVFYDPAVRYQRAEGEESDREDSMRASKEAAKEELRRQVIDFIAWLKAQGIV